MRARLSDLARQAQVSEATVSRVLNDKPGVAPETREAVLAANVAEADGIELLAFEDTGAYRLLLPAMSDDPGELERFYAETVEPLVAYDDQYETDLVQTLETFLECDGNVANTASRLFTHRHTVRYRLERVPDLSGLDVSSGTLASYFAATSSTA